jgi:hypothetical protein
VSNAFLVRVPWGRWVHPAGGAAWSLRLTEFVIVAAGMLLVGQRVLTRHSRLDVAGAATRVAQEAVTRAGLAPAAKGRLRSFLAGLIVLRVVLSPEEKALVACGARRAWYRARCMAIMP